MKGLEIYLVILTYISLTAGENIFPTLFMMFLDYDLRMWSVNTLHFYFIFFCCVFFFLPPSLSLSLSLSLSFKFINQGLIREAE